MEREIYLRDLKDRWFRWSCRGACRGKIWKFRNLFFLFTGRDIGMYPDVRDVSSQQGLSRNSLEKILLQREFFFFGNFTALWERLRVQRQGPLKALEEVSFRVSFQHARNTWGSRAINKLISHFRAILHVLILHGGDVIEISTKFL